VIAANIEHEQLRRSLCVDRMRILALGELYRVTENDNNVLPFPDASVQQIDDLSDEEFANSLVLFEQRRIYNEPLNPREPHLELLFVKRPGKAFGSHHSLRQIEDGYSSRPILNGKFR